METLAPNLEFAEGLRWHRDHLWFSDFLTRRVYKLKPGDAPKEQAFVPGQPSGLGFLPDGSLLVVSMLDRKLLRIESGALYEVASLADIAIGPCNDMAVDAGGNAYIGCFGYELWYASGESGRHLGRVLRVGADGSVTIAASGLGAPNGMAFIDDGHRLVVAETRRRRLSVFDVGGDGSLNNQRIFADLGAIHPDGICADTRGNIWVAGLYHGYFVLVREGGEILDTVPALEDWAVTCILDGRDPDRLYCVSSSPEGGSVLSGTSHSSIQSVNLKARNF